MREKLIRFLKSLSYPHFVLRLNDDGFLKRCDVIKIIESPRRKQQYIIYTSYEDDPSGSKVAYVSRFKNFGPIAFGLSPVESEEF